MSKPEHNVDGLTEFQLAIRARSEQSPCLKFKKRHRKDLSHEEITGIVQLSEQKYWAHKEIARKHRISAQLVFRLVHDSVKKPLKFQKVSDDLDRKMAVVDAASLTLNGMATRKEAIASVDQVVKLMKEHQDEDVTHVELRRIMKKELGYSYRQVKKVPVQSNSVRCLILRQ